MKPLSQGSPLCGLVLAVLNGVSSPWMVPLLPAAAVGFPCQVCNINRKDVTEAPNYRLALFVWKDSEP